MVQTRRDDHVSDTRQALVNAARARFITQGYSHTGTEEIVSDARVSRGALYHHFRDKTELFRAVIDDIAGEVTGRLVADAVERSAAHPAGDAWDGLRDGVASFLQLCVDTDDFQRLVLVDGPVVLGHERWNSLVDQYGSGLLEQWLSRAVADGRIDDIPIAPLAHLLIAMISESSLYIARATDRAAAREAIATVLDRFLDGLERKGPPA